MIDLVGYASFLSCSARSSCRSSACCSPTGCSPGALRARRRLRGAARAGRPDRRVARGLLALPVARAGRAGLVDVARRRTRTPAGVAIGASLPSFARRVPAHGLARPARRASSCSRRLMALVGVVGQRLARPRRRRGRGVGGGPCSRRARAAALGARASIAAQVRRPTEPAAAARRARPAGARAGGDDDGLRASLRRRRPRDDGRGARRAVDAGRPRRPAELARRGCRSAPLTRVGLPGRDARGARPRPPRLARRAGARARRRASGRSRSTGTSTRRCSARRGAQARRGGGAGDRRRHRAGGAARARRARGRAHVGSRGALVVTRGRGRARAGAPRPGSTRPARATCSSPAICVARAGGRRPVAAARRATALVALLTLAP